MKIAISLPDSLFQAAERTAARLGISRSELFQRALQALLEKHEGAEITAALDRVHGQGGSSPGLEDALARIQSASLSKDDW